MHGIIIRPLDAAIVVAYLVGLLAIGILSARRSGTAENYFVGHRDYPGWLIALSMLGSIISSMTFLALPAAAYVLDWRQLTVNLMAPFVALLAVAVFIPFFRRGGLTSAFEYLGMRFGVAARLYGTVNFIVLQLIRLAQVLFLMSLPMQFLTGVPLEWVIGGVGLFVALVTIAGGMETVVVADAVQAVIKVLGGVLCAACLIWAVPGGLARIVEVGQAGDKFSLGSFDWDLTQRTFWTVAILGILNYLNIYSGEQTVVQRYVSARTTREARKATLMFSFVAVPVWTLFFFVGTALWVFFQVAPDPRVAALQVDQILPYFVLTHVPAGLAGLVIAAVLAAAMSAIESGANSIATVTVVDLLRPHLLPGRSDRFYLQAARLTTGAAIALAVGGAILFSRMEKESMNDVSLIVFSVLGGAITGLYMVGFFTRRVDAFAVNVALVVAVATNLYLGLGSLGMLPDHWRLGVHSYWVGAMVNLVFVAVALGVSLVRRPAPRDLTGLTVWTPGRQGAAGCLLIALALGGASLAAASRVEAGEASAPAELPPAFKHGTVSFDGLTLAWADRPGHSPPLVLIPGTFSDCRIYAQLVTRLDPQRRTIILEHAGHGESGPAIGESSVERSAANVTGVLDQLQVESCFLGGHSLGGMVAMEAARQCPERFRGIISIEGWTNSRAADAAFDGDMSSTLSPEMRSRIDAHRHENASRWPPPQQSSFVRVWTKWDGSGFLRDTSLPVLELYGDRRKPRPAAEMLGIPERKNIRLQWIPNASHWLPVEKPADVAAVIEAFIGGVEGPSAPFNVNPTPAAADETVAPRRPTARNAVLIVIDDLGYGDLGCYGSSVNATPGIDALAARGCRFTDFHAAAPLCTPTRAALLTGRYHQRLGAIFDDALSGDRHRDVGLPRETLTLGELCRSAGRATAYFGKWHLGFKPPHLPPDHGFDEFRGCAAAPDYFTRIDRQGKLDWWRDNAPDAPEGYTTDLITRAAVNFIDRNHERPFLLYVAHEAIHFPWQGPDDPPHRVAGRNYDDDKWGVIPDPTNVAAHVGPMLAAVDRSIGAITAALARHGLGESTVVVFTSDNGGYLNYGRRFRNISSNGPFRGQKGEMYEGGHRVPLIIARPGTIPPGVSDVPCNSIDILPTLAGLSGVDAGPVDADGIDLSPLVLRGERPAERRFYWRSGRNSAIRSGAWKLCTHGDRTELFNLAEDLGEQHDVAAALPEKVVELRAAWQAWEADVNRSAAAAGVRR